MRQDIRRQAGGEGEARVGGETGGNRIAEHPGSGLR